MAQRHGKTYSGGFYTGESFRQRDESAYREPYGKGQQYGEGRYPYGDPAYGLDYGDADEDPSVRYGYVAEGYDDGGRYSASRYRERDYDDIYGAYPGRGNYGRRNPEYGALSYRDTGERRGPKGYTRSDERIKEVICEQLWQNDDIDASEVTLDVKDRKVTLTGTVPRRWMRYAIEDIADECTGVEDIANDIRVEERRTSD